MARKLLRIYLQDHLAGAAGGLDLARRAAGANRDGGYGAFLGTLAEDIAEDKAALERLMDQLSIGPDRVKLAAAWAAEKAGRLKLNGSWTSYSPLSRLVELDALSLGVAGKLAMWQALLQVAGSDPVLADFGLERYAERAEAQLDGLERERRRAAREALGA